MDLVPVIDLNAADAAARIDAACRDVGFMAVSGHRVPGSVIADMLKATSEFFTLPLEEKLAWRSPSPEINRGYAAKGTEGLGYSLGETVPPDLFEAFNIGAEDIPRDDPVYQAEGHRLFAPNIWPEYPAAVELRPALTAYFSAVRRLAHRLTGLFATALGLEPTFFESRTDHSTDTLRVNHYHRGPGEPDPLEGQQRMGAHTDYGIVTVLYAEPVPGLQIVGPDGQWYDVMPTPGTFLVNLGDLLAEWTNDHWRSTLHRVVPPPRHENGPATRRSVAFFHDGNYDAVIECLPTCCSPENPPRYPTVRAGEHLMAKLLGPRTLSVSDATSTAGDRLRGPARLA
ncbi:MAG: isopenicillin N synthase family dioxygenase [Acidimicrobiales bacterium]